MTDVLIDGMECSLSGSLTPHASVRRLGYYARSTRLAIGNVDADEGHGGDRWDGLKSSRLPCRRYPCESRRVSLRKDVHRRTLLTYSDVDMSNRLRAFLEHFVPRLAGRRKRQILDETDAEVTDARSFRKLPPKETINDAIQP